MSGRFEEARGTLAALLLVLAAYCRMGVFTMWEVVRLL